MVSPVSVDALGRLGSSVASPIFQGFLRPVVITGLERSHRIYSKPTFDCVRVSMIAEQKERSLAAMDANKDSV